MILYIIINNTHTFQAIQIMATSSASKSASKSATTSICQERFNLTPPKFNLPRFNLPRFNLTSRFNLPRLTASKLVVLYYKTLKCSRYTHNDKIHYFLDLCATSVDVEVHAFRERALENIFLSIQTLENEERTYNQNEEKCMRHYGLTQAEVMRLFFALRNYHLLNAEVLHAEVLHLDTYYTPKGLYLFCDVSDDDAECNRCGFISKNAKAYKADEADEADVEHEADIKMIFYYSTSDGPNVPVCTECYWSTQTPRAATAAAAKEVAKEATEEEQFETELETCVNCGRVWDGYAQCTCWGLSYNNTTITLDHNDDNANIDEEEGLIKTIINPLYTIYKNIPMPIPAAAAAASYNNNNNNNYANLPI